VINSDGLSRMAMEISNSLTKRLAIFKNPSKLSSSLRFALKSV